MGVEIVAAGQEPAKQLLARGVSNCWNPRDLGTNPFVESNQLEREHKKILFKPAGRKGGPTTRCHALYPLQEESLAIVMQGGKVRQGWRLAIPCIERVGQRRGGIQCYSFHKTRTEEHTASLHGFERIDVHGVFFPGGEDQEARTVYEKFT